MDSFNNILKEEEKSMNNDENNELVKEKLNEYFKLKYKYETQISSYKKKIINNITLSKKEKRMEYLKIKPKCINCKRPGGTIFKTIFIKDNDVVDSHKQYTAVCGIIADPCNLNIKIEISNVELLPNLLNQIENELKDLKNTVIKDKNKLLFGYLTTEEALENFDDLKDSIMVYTSIYENYLRKYNEIVDNEDKKRNINESKTIYYNLIEQIKECIKKMNELNNLQYAKDVVNIYQGSLIPLMLKIRKLSYDETFVWHNMDSNTCNLIQNKYSINNLSFKSFENKVVNFDIGFENQTKIPKKVNLIIESDNSSDSFFQKNPKEEDKVESNSLFINSSQNEEPNIINGKVEWNQEIQKSIWEKLPSKFKQILTENPEWLNEFMKECVLSREKKEKCKFIQPKNLKIPPTKLENGSYDFGISIYNEVFNKLPDATKKTYLSLYNEVNGIKNYKLLIDALNKLVEKEVNFI